MDGGVSCPGRRDASAEPLIDSPADRQLEPPLGINAHPERHTEAGRTGNLVTFSLQNHTRILLLFVFLGLFFFCRDEPLSWNSLVPNQKLLSDCSRLRPVSRFWSQDQLTEQLEVLLSSGGAAELKVRELRDS